MIFINGCDPATGTNFEIVNESTYDLHLEFKTRELHSYQNGYGEPNIKIGESVFYLLQNMGLNSYRDPNKEIEFIIFYHLDSNDIINEVNKNNLPITGGKDYYKLKITDELLF
jgi:hypothetical protein